MIVVKVIVDIVKSLAICSIVALIIGGFSYCGMKLYGKEYNFGEAVTGPFLGAVAGHYGIRFFMFLKRVRK